MAEMVVLEGWQGMRSRSLRAHPLLPSVAVLRVVPHTLGMERARTTSAQVILRHHARPNALLPSRLAVGLPVLKKWLTTGMHFQIYNGRKFFEATDWKL
jgi:hypothetical protein